MPSPGDVPARDYLVVSECYPPNSVGGAELSLASTLSASRVAADILVVNILGRAPQVTQHRVDGIPVIELPPQAKWPYHRLSEAERARIQAELPKPIGWLLFAFHALAYLLSGRLDRVVARFLMLATLPFRVRRNGPFAPFDTEDTGYWSLALRRILAASGASTVHGDNLLGILLTQAAGGAAARRVGVVRDNRFLCVRRDQQTRMGGKVCVACHAECHTGTRFADRRLRRIARHIGWMRRRALRGFDEVVVTSRYLERQIRSLGAMPPLTRIANPAGDASGRDTPAVPEWDGTNIFIVGQIHDNKGQEALVAWLPELIRRIPDVKLHFAGRGDAARDRMIAAAGAEAGRLRFHGYVSRDDIRALYQSCQIAALPTRWPEPFGRVPLEAGIERKPVIAFGVGGLPEQIVHGVTGLVVPAGDYAGFVDALAKLAADPSLRERLGAAAARHVAARYDRNETARAYEALWQSPVAVSDGSRTRRIASG
ncbi:hypothetical protein K32_31570 [Kaistia sp. 32K]|uniref:glycosyltransferase family 4 protein n=1 Tax=Kaistia sp. 32K TaxID=2795690 RepID=UPI001914E59D|nr:glycosyltransferase family 4 protein [Kaistia sp. 32K]BCP54540.1 hypothetical protein K32_31570 [Kaistia sp. 32K]